MAIAWHYIFSPREIYFAFKGLFWHLYYFVRTGDSGLEVKYAWHKLWKELTQPLRWVKYVFWRLWIYREVLMYDFHWDHGFLLTLLEIKFLQMGKYHRDHGICNERADVALELFECAELCHRIHEDDYTKVEDAAHEEKWGKAKFSHPPAL